MGEILATMRRVVSGLKVSVHAGFEFALETDAQPETPQLAPAVVATSAPQEFKEVRRWRTHGDTAHRELVLLYMVNEADQEAKDVNEKNARGQPVLYRYGVVTNPSPDAKPELPEPSAWNTSSLDGSQPLQLLSSGPITCEPDAAAGLPPGAAFSEPILAAEAMDSYCTQLNRNGFDEVMTALKEMEEGFDLRCPPGFGCKSQALAAVHTNSLSSSPPAKSA